MVTITSFQETLDNLRALSKSIHLLLGNGFSIALNKNIFSYNSLFSNADFSKSPMLKNVFDELKTNDFEIIIRHLQNTAKIISIYRPNLSRIIQRLNDDANYLKDVLVKSIAGHHPSLPHDISPSQYATTRTFLNNFSNIYTLNYDVLLYWSLMQDEVDSLKIKSDDGFRHPDDPQEPDVSWMQANKSNVHYLHGALHLFDKGTEVIKYTWSKTDVPLINQIRKSLDEDKFPIFVTEGSWESKMEKIMHNAYLHKSLRSFEGSVRSKTSSLVIFGHSLHENDSHILNRIAEGSTQNLAISLYGDLISEENINIIEQSKRLKSRRSRFSNVPLNVHFFDSETVRLWS